MGMFSPNIVCYVETSYNLQFGITRQWKMSKGNATMTVLLVICALGALS